MPFACERVYQSVYCPVTKIAFLLLAAKLRIKVNWIERAIEEEGQLKYKCWNEFNTEDTISLLKSKNWHWEKGWPETVWVMFVKQAKNSELPLM